MCFFSELVSVIIVVNCSVNVEFIEDKVLHCVAEMVGLYDSDVNEEQHMKQIRSYAAK